VSADLSVVICSLNGAAGVRRCLSQLSQQTISGRIEVIVTDDGSRDDTSQAARDGGAVVIRHPVNRGIAAARNSGVAAATAPVVAFLDDDCEPAPQWAERLLAGYADGVAGVGGPIVPQTPAGFARGYLERHNPLQPLELDLASSDQPVYRLGLYLRRQWSPPPPRGQRDVYSLVGANMSFRREVLAAAGGFDERFRFGAEEVDLCRRLHRASHPVRLVWVADAPVTHHFPASLPDILRRSRAYGRGSARLYRKWPGLSPTLFPGPVLVAALLGLSPAFPPLAVAALAVPQVLYPQGLRGAAAGRGAGCLLDSYVQLAQEAWEDLGFAQGLWAFRHLVPEQVA
jgi:GT2 family glycosyltransferase